MKNLDISLTIKAIDQASATIKRLENSFPRLASAGKGAASGMRSAIAESQGAWSSSSQNFTSSVEGMKASLGGLAQQITSIFTARLAWDLPGQIQQGIGHLGQAFEQAKQLQVEQISNASSLDQMVNNLDYKGATIALSTLNKDLAKAAAALPGSTQDYVEIAMGIQDDLIAAYSDPKGNLDVKAWQDAAAELASAYGVIQSSTPGVTGTATAQVLAAALGGARSTAELSNLDLIQKNNSLKNAIVKELGKAGAVNFDEIKDVGKRVEVLMKASETMASKEFRERASNTIEGLTQSYISSFIDPSTGIFGFFRDLDQSTPETESVMDDFNATFMEVIGPGGIFASLGRIFSALTGMTGDTPMLTLSKGLKGLNNFLGSVGRGLETLANAAEKGGVGGLFRASSNLVPKLGSMLGGGIEKMLGDAIPAIVNGLSGAIVGTAKLGAGLGLRFAQALISLDWLKVFRGAIAGAAKVDWIRLGTAIAIVSASSVLAAKAVIAAQTVAAMTSAKIGQIVVGAIVKPILGSLGGMAIAGPLTAALAGVKAAIASMGLALLSGIASVAASVAVAFGIVGVGVAAFFVTARLLGLTSKDFAKFPQLLSDTFSLFGAMATQAGAEVRLRFAQVKAAIGGAIAGAVDAVNLIKAAWPQMVADAKGAVDAFAGLAVAQIRNLWNVVELGFVLLKAHTRPLWQPVVATVQGAIAAFVEGVALVKAKGAEVKAAIAAFLAPVLQPMAAIGTQLAGAAVGFFGGISAPITWATSTAQMLGGGIIQSVTGFFGGISAPVTTATGTASALGSMVSWAVAGLFGGMKAIVDGAKAIADGAGAAIGGAISGLFAGASALIAGFRATIDGGMKLVGEGISGLFSWIGSAVSGLVDKVRGAINQAMGALGGILGGTASVPVPPAPAASAPAAMWRGHIPKAIPAAAGIVPQGLFRAVRSEMANMPSGASLAIANTSEAILRPEQLRALVSGSVAAGASAAPSASAMVRPAPTPTAPNQTVNLGPIVINVTNPVPNASEMAEAAIAEIERRLSQTLNARLV